MRRWAVTAKKICPILLPLWVAVSLAMGMASAASPSLSDIEDQNRRARQQAEERQQREQQKDVFLQKEITSPANLPLPEETPSFAITSLVLEGDSADRFPWAQAMLDRYAGRKIGMLGVNIIVKQLMNAFIDRGYITTRVVVPEQDLDTGRLRLTVVPGRIGNILFDEGSPRLNWRNAFPTRPGDILNLRNIEQGLEQMMRVPSQDSTLR